MSAQNFNQGAGRRRSWQQAEARLAEVTRARDEAVRWLHETEGKLANAEARLQDAARLAAVLAERIALLEAALRAGGSGDRMKVLDQPNTPLEALLWEHDLADLFVLVKQRRLADQARHPAAESVSSKDPRKGR